MQTWQPLFIGFFVPLGLFIAAVRLVGFKPTEVDSAQEQPRSAMTRESAIQTVGIIALGGIFVWALQSELRIVAMVLGCLFLGYYYANSLWMQLKANGFDDLPREKKFAPIFVGLIGTVAFIVWAYYLVTLVHARA